MDDDINYEQNLRRLLEEPQPGPSRSKRPRLSENVNERNITTPERAGERNIITPEQVAEQNLTTPEQVDQRLPGLEEELHVISPLDLNILSPEFPEDLSNITPEILDEHNHLTLEQIDRIIREYLGTNLFVGKIGWIIWF